MDTITKNLGYVLITASILRLLNVVEFSAITQLSFALSALFLTIADLVSFKHDIETNNDYISTKVKNKIYLTKLNLWHYLSLASLIILPNLKLSSYFDNTFLNDFFTWYITNINDSATLLALGIVIALISFKRSKETIDEHKKINLVIKQLQKEIDELRNKIK
ncbi:hypothetical protein HFN20_09605 [Paenibacillus dendritiformis]|nr:hypothetical protein [Paenibacillus dendritiformis]